MICKIKKANQTGVSVILLTTDNIILLMKLQYISIIKEVLNELRMDNNKTSLLDIIEEENKTYGCYKLKGKLIYIYLR